MNWTDAADELLISLWGMGRTKGAVAEEMRAAGHPVESRSAISGRMNRLRQRGVVFSKREPPQFTPARQPKPPKPKPLPWEAPVKRRRAVAHDNGVEYLANHDGCKAILDTRGGRYNLRKCCGKSREPGTPYCAGHLKAYLNIPAARK